MVVFIKVIFSDRTLIILSLYLPILFVLWIYLCSLMDLTLYSFHSKKRHPYYYDITWYLLSFPLHLHNFYNYSDDNNQLISKNQNNKQVLYRYYTYYNIQWQPLCYLIYSNPWILYVMKLPIILKGKNIRTIAIFSLSISLLVRLPMYIQI